MKNFLVLSFLLGFSLIGLIVGCSGKSSPTAPSSPSKAADTPTVTSTPTPVGIYWQSAQIYGYNGAGDYATLNVAVSGAPVTNVSAIVTGNGMTAPVTLAYIGNTVISGITYASYFSSSANLNYTPGKTYTLTTTSGSFTAAATLVAPGNITVASNGSQASWTEPGSFDTVSVVQNSVTIFNSGDVVSPYSVPATVYALGGGFTVLAVCANETSGAETVTGAVTGSFFTVYDEISQSLSVNTPTPTPTNPGGDTSTPTATNTITPTFTQTQAATITPTGTRTPGITWSVGTVNGYADGTADAVIGLQVNGQPNTNVTAVISGPALSSPVTIPYMATYSGYAEYSGALPGYQPGQTYVLTTYTSAGTASATVAAPGGIFTFAPDGSSVSWTVPGNTGFVEISKGGTVISDNSNNGISPASIPVSTYASGGAYVILADVAKYTSSVTGALLINNNVLAGQQAAVTLTFNTATPTTTETPANTATYSFTPTVSNTPSFSSTPTNTPTVTQSNTMTDTLTITQTPTITSTSTITPTLTWTGTPTNSPTITATATPPPEVINFNGSAGSNYSDLRFDTNGNLWLTDDGNNSLQKWTTAGVGPGVNITNFNSGNTFSSPIGLDVDQATNNVYVADYVNERVVVFSQTGSYLNTITSAQFTNFIRGVAVNSAGTTVAVLDSTDNKIVQFSIGGSSSNPTYSYTGYIYTGSDPENLAYAATGGIWVALSTGSIVEYDPATGATLATLTTSGSNTPWDVQVDGSGNVFVASDSVGGRSEEFSSTGQLINFWNSSVTGIAVYGPGNLVCEVVGSGSAVYGYQIH